MAYDADGNWVDESEEESPEELKADEPETEEAPEQEEAPNDIGEYIRRARLGVAIGSGALGENTPYPEGEGAGAVGAVNETPGQNLYKPGPAMQAYKAEIGNEPLRQDNPPSILRRVFAGIAGAGAGIASGNDAGAKAATGIRDAGYNRQLSNYQQELAQKGQQAQLEAGGNQAARQYYLDLAKVQSENTKSQANLSQKEAEASRAGYFKSRAKVADYSITPEGQQAAKDLAQARVRPPGAQVPWKVVTKDGKTHVGVLQPGGAFKEGDTIIPTEQIDAEKTAKLGVKEPNAPQVSVENQTATDIKKRHPDWNMEQVMHAISSAKEQPTKPPVVFVPDGKGGMTPQVAQFGHSVPVGTTTSGGMSTESVQANKQIVDENKALEDNKKAYQMANSFAKQETGPGDVALVMQFMGAIKPENIGKIRFNPQEQNFIMGARNSLGDLDALLQKVSSGAKLVPQQRKQMLDTMKIMASPQAATGGKVSYGGYDFPNQAAADAFKTHMAVK